MGKHITRWDPLSWGRLPELEQHYLQVHTRFVRRLLREVEGAVSYHTNRVLRQRDVAGGWALRPRAWRFALVRMADSAITRGSGPAIPERIRARFDRDHVNFLRNLRSCLVEESVAFDRVAGQTAFDKYLLEVDRRPDVGHDEALAILDPMVRALLAGASGAFGARRGVVNRVVAEAESGPVVEEGQRFQPDRYRPETDKVGYVELYFDQAEWADEFFAQRRELVDAILDEPAFRVAELYHVEERCGLDRRVP